MFYIFSEVESRLIEIDSGYNESYVPVKNTKKNSVKLSKTIFDANGGKNYAFVSS